MTTIYKVFDGAWFNAKTLNLNKSVNASMLQLRIYDVDDKLNPLVRETVKNNTMIEQDF